MENTKSAFIRNISLVGEILVKVYQIFKTPEIFARGKRYEHPTGLCKWVPFCGMLTDFLGNVLNPFDDSDIKVAASGHFPNGASLQ